MKDLTFYNLYHSGGFGRSPSRATAMCLIEAIIHLFTSFFCVNHHWPYAPFRFNWKRVNESSGGEKAFNWRVFYLSDEWLCKFNSIFEIYLVLAPQNHNWPPPPPPFVCTEICSAWPGIMYCWGNNYQAMYVQQRGWTDSRTNEEWMTGRFCAPLRFSTHTDRDGLYRAAAHLNWTTTRCSPHIRAFQCVCARAMRESWMLMHYEHPLLANILRIHLQFPLGSSWNPWKDIFCAEFSK